MQHAHLGQQFTHVARTAARSRLIGGNRSPLHQVLSKQAAQRHQHQADGTVTADKGFDPTVDTLANHRMVDRIEDDDGIIFHAQRGGRINPVSLPAAGAQLWIDVTGVVAALAGNDDIQRPQRLNIKRILQCALLFARKCGCRLTMLRRREEDRIDCIKITLFTHAGHQHGADHTAPTNKTYILHVVSV